jgi:hypothetical protein
MPLIETKGAASAQGFGEFAKTGEAVYIESCFSTWLYTGNGSTQTITNGIDLSTKGGLVWLKDRTSALAHQLFDTARGATKALASNSTGTEDVQSTSLTSFNTTGFSLDSYFRTNGSGDNFASWTFRKQPKFFDVVTYTGNGGVQNISHSLGSVPGCIIVKSTSSAFDWAVYHRSLGATKGVYLNTTQAEQTNNTLWNDTAPTSTQFTVGNSSGPSSSTNANGVTYVAYLFAHDAGGFGLTGTDNVISCGSVTADGSGNATVNLGYEPQWILIKSSSEVNGWALVDTMRGLPADGLDKYLLANSSAAEASGGIVNINATGFYANATLSASATYIYIAIRRGPMKTPTTGTSVFNPVARTGTGTNPTVVTTGNNLDLLMSFPRTASPAAYGMLFWDKLRGVTQMLQSASTSAEIATNSTRTLQGWTNTGYQAGADFIEGYLNYSGSTYVNYPITRAPGFFDVVCISGGSGVQTINHNLGVAPEICIFKRRNGTSTWPVQTPSLYLQLNTTAANLGTPFITNFGATSLTADAGSFSSGETWVGYLFASCPGVSKVGSYTGTGALQTVNCGFTGGARFVLIKRTDSTGDWYVWDSARGIVSGNDPYLLLNSTAAEVTNTDYVDTYSAGFEISSTAPAAINANGGTFVFLAVA